VSQLWKTVLFALGISLAIAGVTLFLLVQFMPSSTAADPPPRYTIGVWEGRVAVFEGEQAFPKQIFDSFVSTLPSGQRAQVEDGIPVEDDTQLSLLLEDLTS